MYASMSVWDATIICSVNLVHFFTSTSFVDVLIINVQYIYIYIFI
jgi:hypothetical protein